MVAFFGCENVEIDLKYQPIFHRVDHAFTMAPWDSIIIAINIIMATTTTTSRSNSTAATPSHLRSSVHNYDQWHTHFPSCTIF